MNPSLDFERIEKSFSTIAAIPSAWQRRLLLDQSATFHGIVKASYRQAFELWRLERSADGKGRRSMTTQLSLLLPVRVAAPAKPVLSIEPVPFEISLAPGQRFYFRVVQGDRAFTYQVSQLTELEALVLLRGLSQLDWSLNEAGIPRDFQAIGDYIAAAIGGAA